MLKLPIPWPPICEACGQPILSLDTGVVVVSEDATVPEIERARFALHGFCATEELRNAVDLREFAKLVKKAERKNRAG